MRAPTKTTLARPSQRRHRDVPPPPVSRLLFRWFASYARRYMGRHFHGLRLHGPTPKVPDDAPLIVYLNHPSWWDPLTCVVLATAFFPQRTHYGPIDSAGLARYPFLKRLGFFGVDPDPRRGGIDFLRAAQAIVSRPDCAVWITAEGEFTDPRVRPTRIRPGVAHIARKLTGGVILPLAVEYVYWQERTAEALVRFGKPVELPRSTPLSVGEWTGVLEANLQAAQDTLAAAAMTRDPAQFDAILGGQAGVGGVYDLWRRAKALVRGQRFRAEHGASA